MTDKSPSSAQPFTDSMMSPYRQPVEELLAEFGWKTADIVNHCFD